MDLEATRKALVAVDLGAQSCRVSLLRWKQGEPEIKVIHRFPNAPLTMADGLRWDVEAIFGGIKTGLKLCAAEASEGIASIGVDGWGVDYVRLNEKGEAAANPFCYRDARTERAEKMSTPSCPPRVFIHLQGFRFSASTRSINCTQTKLLVQIQPCRG